MIFNILTLFPEAIDPYLKASILGRAQTANAITVKLWNIRDFATDKHKTTDDTPYGGGAGMVMKIEPIDRALEIIEQAAHSSSGLRARAGRESLEETSEGGVPEPASLGPARKARSSRAACKTIVLSARGTPFTQAKAAEYAKLESLTLIAGRYEGIDQRVADHLADEEISVGPYVLSGGELPALIVVDAVARLLPGVLGNPESLADSVSLPSEAPPRAGRSWAHYTKPAEYNGWKVPEVLLSGNHEDIANWRKEQRK